MAVQVDILGRTLAVEIMGLIYIVSLSGLPKICLGILLKRQAGMS